MCYWKEAARWNLDEDRPFIWFGVQAVIHMHGYRESMVNPNKLPRVYKKRQNIQTSNLMNMNCGKRTTRKKQCFKNTDVSSNAMETQGAVDMWSRSVDKIGQDIRNTLVIATAKATGLCSI